MAIQHARWAPRLGAALAIVFVVSGCAGSAATTPAPSPSASPVSLTHATPAPCAPAQTTVVQPIPWGARTDWPALERQAPSLWQDGSVYDPGAGCWQAFYVFGQIADPTTHPVAPEIDTTVARASTEAVAFYEHNFSLNRCPRAIGNLTITRIAGTTVSFRSSTGVTGTFDLATKTWRFGD